MMQHTATMPELPFKTAGEWAAHLRWRGLVAQEQGLGGFAHEVLGKPVDRLEAVLFRTEGVSFADRAVVESMRQLGAISRRLLPAWPVLRAYRELGCEVGELDDIRRLPLDLVERALSKVGAGYLTGAGLGGAIAGSLGAVGVVAGIPPLLFASLHAIHRLGLFHGHDPRDSAEEQFALLILVTSLVSRPSLRAPVLQRLQTVAHGLEFPSAASASSPSSRKITENVAESLAVQLLLGLTTRSFPLAGLLIGAGYSRAFVARACDTARAAYGQRALLRKYGDAASVGAEPPRV